MAFISVGVGMDASQRIPLFWRETPTDGCEISLGTGRGRGKEGPRAVKRSEHNRPVDWREQSGQQKRAGARPVDSGRVGQRDKMSQPFFVALWEFRSSTRSCELTEAQNARKVSQTSPFLHLELTQARDCLFFFSSTLSVVYVVGCMSVKKCEIPLAGDKKNHYTIGWPCVVWMFEIVGGRPAVYCHNIYEYIKHGLLSLYNGISTFVGYLMTKPPL